MNILTFTIIIIISHFSTTFSKSRDWVHILQEDDNNDNFSEFQPSIYEKVDYCLQSNQPIDISFGYRFYQYNYEIREQYRLFNESYDPFGGYIRFIYFNVSDDVDNDEIIKRTYICYVRNEEYNLNETGEIIAGMIYPKLFYDELYEKNFDEYMKNEWKGELGKTTCMMYNEMVLEKSKIGCENHREFKENEPLNHYTVIRYKLGGCEKEIDRMCVSKVNFLKEKYVPLSYKNYSVGFTVIHYRYIDLEEIYYTFEFSLRTRVNIYKDNELIKTIWEDGCNSIDEGEDENEMLYYSETSNEFGIKIYNGCFMERYLNFFDLNYLRNIANFLIPSLFFPVGVSVVLFIVVIILYSMIHCCGMFQCFCCCNEKWKCFCEKKIPNDDTAVKINKCNVFLYSVMYLFTQKLIDNIGLLISLASFLYYPVDNSKSYYIFLLSYDFLNFSLMGIIVIYFLVDFVALLLFVNINIVNFFRTSILYGLYEESIYRKVIAFFPYSIFIGIAVGWSFFYNIIVDAALDVTTVLEIIPNVFKDLRLYSLLLAWFILFYKLFNIFGYNGGSSFSYKRKLSMKECRNTIPDIRISTFSLFTGVQTILNQVITTCVILKADEGVKKQENEQPLPYRKRIKEIRKMSIHSHHNWSFIQNLNQKELEVLIDFLIGDDEKQEETNSQILKYFPICTKKWMKAFFIKPKKSNNDFTEMKEESQTELNNLKPTVVEEDVKLSLNKDKEEKDINGEEDVKSSFNKDEEEKDNDGIKEIEDNDKTNSDLNPSVEEEELNLEDEDKDVEEEEER